jgi:hypothetical protein
VAPKRCCRKYKKPPATTRRRPVKGDCDRLLDLERALVAAVRARGLNKRRRGSVDGRVDSVFAEDTVISYVKAAVKHCSGVVVAVPKARHWHDIAVKWPGMERPYYFNIKVSTGGNDNACNKKALVCCFSTLEESKIPNSMTLNAMYDLIEEHRKTLRPADHSGEYFYLYVDKLDGTVLIRSLCDIQAWVANPHNLLQINWTQEKKGGRRRTNGRRLAPIKTRVFGHLKTAVRKYVESCDRFLTLH